MSGRIERSDNRERLIVGVVIAVAAHAAFVLLVPLRVSQLPPSPTTLTVRLQPTRPPASPTAPPQTAPAVPQSAPQPVPTQPAPIERAPGSDSAGTAAAAAGTTAGPAAAPTTGSDTARAPRERTFTPPGVAAPTGNGVAAERTQDFQNQVLQALAEYNAQQAQRSTDAPADRPDATSDGQSELATLLAQLDDQIDRLAASGDAIDLSRPEPGRPSGSGGPTVQGRARISGSGVDLSGIELPAQFPSRLMYTVAIEVSPEGATRVRSVRGGFPSAAIQARIEQAVSGWVFEPGAASATADLAVVIETR